MNKYDLLIAIGNVHDKYILECDKFEGRLIKKKSNTIKVIGIAASLIIVFGLIFTVPKLLMGDIPYVDTVDSGEDTTSEKFPEYPTDDEVMSEYRKAKEYSFWFWTSSSLIMVDLSKPPQSVIINNSQYFLVDRYATYADFKNALREVFSEDITEDFLGLPYFIEHEGKLYSVMGDSGSNISLGGASYEIVRENKNKIILKVSVELKDFHINGWLEWEKALYPFCDGEVIDSLVFDFPYEKIGDNWVFTKFPNFSIDYREVLDKKYTEYKSELGTLVLPSEYDDVTVVENNLTVNSPYNEDVRLMFLVHYVPDKELGYNSDNWVFSVRRMTYSEYSEVSENDPGGMSLIGYDGEYFYTLSTVTYLANEPTEEYYNFISECQRAIRTYMPLENGWTYANKLPPYEK